VHEGQVNPPDFNRSSEHSRTGQDIHRAWLHEANEIDLQLQQP